MKIINLKILIADDHSVVIAGTKMILEAAFPNIKVETAKSYTEMLHIYEKGMSDILLLDINMPGTKNLAMITELKKINPRTKIVVFSSYDEVVALRYIQAGADGYINKMSENNELIYAINAVAKNGFYYSQKLTKLAMNLLGQDTITKDPNRVLSEREVEVFELLLAGTGNLEISNKLGLHMSTVSTYKKRILQKLKIDNLAHLIKQYHQFN